MYDPQGQQTLLSQSPQADAMGVNSSASQGAGAMGAAQGAMGSTPWGAIAQAALAVINNQKHQEQAHKNAIANAEMMRNSPWTQLGGAAAQGQQSQQEQANKMYTTGKDLTGNLSNIYGGYKMDQEKDAANKAADAREARWLAAYNAHNGQ